VSQHEDRYRRPSGRERVRLLEGRLTGPPTPPVGATGGRRFRLSASIDPLLVGSDLYLVRAGGDDLVVRDASHADRAVVELLAQHALTVAELGLRLRLGTDIVRAKVDALDAAGALVPGGSSTPLEPEDAERFSRQRPYLAEYGDANDAQRALAGARVAVVGCGGLGTWAIAALAATGVRRFRLVDDDTVELSNLNRQAIYRFDQLGTAKVDAASEWLRSFDPRIDVERLARRVDGAAAVEAVVEEVDVLVLTADEPPYELGRWVNAACVDARVPFITGGQLPPVVRIGPLHVPGRTPCFACHEAALRAESVAYDRYVEHVQASPSRAATLGPASALVGSLLAMEVMHLLVGAEPATATAALSVDIRTLSVSRADVPRDPACEACASLW
jgi:molybdopterin-synthase adenylyltransferase